MRLFFKKLGYDTLVKKSSGIVLAAKTKFDMVDTTTTQHKGLIMGSLKIGNMYIDIAAAYGPQETETQEVREEFYNGLQIEVEACINPWKYSSCYWGPKLKN